MLNKENAHQKQILTAFISGMTKLKGWTERKRIKIIASNFWKFVAAL